MTYSLIWLPEVLRGAGLKVAECDGWRNRGRGDMSPVRGVICHHTGGLPPGRGTMTSLRTLVEGRNNLAGPLSQLGLGRDGTFYVIAAGKANHAGPGEFKQRRDGNSSFIGIEAENSGRPDDHWPDVQMDAYVRGAAAILRRIGADVDMCIAHKEWAPGRKIDPLFDMGMFRDSVRAVLEGTATTRGLIPARALVPVAAQGTTRELPTQRRGQRNERPLVDWLQTKLGMEVSGSFDPATEARVRAFQRATPDPDRPGVKLVDDGIVGPKSWQMLIAQFPPGPP